MNASRPSTRIRRLRRWAIAIGLGLAASVTIGWLVIASLLRAAPTWWRQVRVSEAETQQIAQDVENNFVTLVHLGREGVAEPGGRWRSAAWSVSIPAADANAWINARLPKWLETSGSSLRLPPEFNELQVQFDDGRAWIGVAHNSPDGDAAHGTADTDHARILSAAITPEIDADGMLTIRLDTIYVGRLPISRAVLGEVVDRIGAGGDAEIKETIQTLLSGKRIGAEPVMELEDGRRVRITALRPRDGRLEVTCVTEHGGS